MKTVFSVVVMEGNRKRNLDLVCDDVAVSITVLGEKLQEKTYFEKDFYKCFAMLRRDNPNFDFYCKGAKINVHPSNMSSQMSLGLKAYELVVGKAPSLDDLVFIFDYEENGLTKNPDEQRLFYLNWTKS